MLPVLTESEVLGGGTLDTGGVGGVLFGSHSNISNTWWLCSYMLETAHLLRNFGRGDLSPL